MIDYFDSSHRRRLILREGRERAISNRHPWIFAGAVHREEGPDDAALADLVTRDGEVLASGLWSPHSQIRLRVLTWGGEPLTGELFDARIRASIRRRDRLFAGGATTAARLVNAEGDDLSGLVVDRYDDLLVVEIGNYGLDKLRPRIASLLGEIHAPRIVHWRDDVPARKIERLPQAPSSEGDGKPEAIIRENGLSYRVDAAGGQKTGFFLDQRDNRQIVRERAADRRTVNLFSYTGGFGVAAAAGGASFVDDVDISAPALELARENHERNGSADRSKSTEADVFSWVRSAAVAGEKYDLVVCDPPAFAKSRNEVERAARGYKDVNLYAFRLAAPGALVATFSCSGHMPLELFQKVVFSAALDAGRRVSFLRRLGAGMDHPVSLFCPEGEYLKGFLLEVLD